MKIKVLLFGSLLDATEGKTELQLEGMKDIDSLKTTLLENYPKLDGYTFRIALNQQILDNNKQLNNNDVVALLPPFAGG